MGEIRSLRSAVRGPAVVLLACSGLRDSRVGEIIKESAYLKMNRRGGGGGAQFSHAFRVSVIPPI